MHTLAAGPPPLLWVVCLCADWCGLCGDYRRVFTSIAAEHPKMCFAWVDIEDEAELVGELDIETFPTLLVFNHDGLKFFGPLLPHAHTLSRLLDALRMPGAKTLAHDALTAAAARAMPVSPHLWISPTAA